MPAPKGNQYWQRARRNGRRPTYETADTLWEACCEYFEWVEENPLYTTDTVKFQGEARIIKVPKPRAMTIQGLCLFIGLTHETWAQYRKRDQDFSEVTLQVDAIIRTQKFEGAAADLFNASIISRDLGLAEQQAVDTSLQVGPSLSDILDDVAQQRLDLKAKK